ncbi:MAG TPA: polysaccharide deacetylase family protein [Polyangiaceae bacterium]|nr:polysaccharide deacetylase family protein [Polyangiaceae bacterium]
MRKIVSLLFLLIAPVACSETTSGTSSNTGGKGGDSGDNFAVYNCGLPAAGATGVAKPSGTPGNLKVLDWAGNKGAVTYTFDDANSSQISNYPALQALGVHMTFYIQTGKTEASNAIWSQALQDGHELGNHTKSHAQTATAEDIDAAQQFLKEKFGVTAWTMAAPYGDASYVSAAKDKFIINRGVSNAVIAPNGKSDQYNLPCYIPPQDAKADAFNAEIDSAQAAGGWRVVLVHGFNGGSDSAYQPVSIDEFTAGVDHAKSLGNMWIDSMVNVGSYWLGQKLVSAVQATTSGSEQTYTWTLPSVFPPGKCLRVTVDGGTLKQGGKTLSWDSHGYYEISLDAGSLTVSQ